ncbi:hypothetical protein QQS21_006956 [Conoideocrella luteorostrata]|uniref:Uncharacterized protein n=1 Tax=Conoideocrella luteorostrata TaxID=1105319 RepID=A0AAJ0CR21_9HYPO|nr:hypothetical protein QQS21_006956 [Conoideocrella luteorostrata]
MVGQNTTTEDPATVSQVGAVDVAEVERVASGIESMLSETGEKRLALQQISQDLRHICDTHPAATCGPYLVLNVTSAVANDVTLAVDDCHQLLSEIKDIRSIKIGGSRDTAGATIDRLERSAERLRRIVEISMAHGSDAVGAAAATASSSDSPPSYETATNITETHAGSSRPRPFVPYSDETAPSANENEQSISSKLLPLKLSAVEGRESSHDEVLMSVTDSSRHGSNKWTGSTPKRVSRVAPSISPGHVILRTRCFHSRSQLRLALATKTLLQVYDALQDSLLWELHGNSSQLVEGNEEPLSFGEGFRPSPDGSLVCVIAYRKNQRRLLIIDADTGWVKLEYLVSPTDGTKPHFSPDNTKVVLCHSGNATDTTGQFKIFSLVEGQGQAKVRQIRFDKPESWQGMAIRFAPDSKHIITCAGPIRRVKDAAHSVSVRVYDEATGEVVRSAALPCPPKFNSTSQTVKFAADFHFPNLHEWLVSFPDYSGTGKTCIVNARLGQTVAVFSSQLTLSQKWQVGVSPPGKVEVAYDKESGIFTRMELSDTMIPRGQTVTITKFALSANGGREKAILRKPYQIRAAVLSCKHADVCGLSPDGSNMFVQQGAAGKVDVISLAI